MFGNSIGPIDLLALPTGFVAGGQVCCASPQELLHARDQIEDPLEDAHYSSSAASLSAICA